MAVILETGIEMGLFYIDNAYFGCAGICFYDKLWFLHRYLNLSGLAFVCFRLFFSNFIANWMSKTNNWDEKLHGWNIMQCIGTFSTGCTIHTGLNLKKKKLKPKISLKKDSKL